MRASAGRAAPSWTMAHMVSHTRQVRHHAASKAIQRRRDARGAAIVFGSELGLLGVILFSRSVFAGWTKDWNLVFAQRQGSSPVLAERTLLYHKVWDAERLQRFLGFFSYLWDLRYTGVGYHGTMGYACRSETNVSWVCG